MRKIILASCAISYLLIFSNVLAQTGPGGVEQTNGASKLLLWLDASKGTFSDAGTTTAINGGNIQQWNDLSGYGHHASQTTAANQIALNEGFRNGYSSVVFNSSQNDVLNHSFSLDPSTTDYSFICVFNVSGSQQALIQQLDGSGTGRTNMYTTGNNSPISSFIGGSTRASTINYTNGSWAVAGVAINANGGSSSISFHQNGASGGTVSGFSIEASDGGWITGSNKNGSSQFINGNVAELILIDKLLSAAELIVIQNYLSAKYNVSLTANDHFSYKTTFPGNVIGIGQASDGSNHTSSQGDGILEISNASALSNGEFLFVGHNREEVQYIDTCDLPGIYGKRLNRVWRADETGDVGSIDVSFDLSGVAGLGSQSDLVLLVSNTSSFANATVHTTGRSLVGNTLSFSGLNLSAGQYFTVAQAGIYYGSGSWHNGSGAGNRPSTADAGKKISINGTVALTANAACECIEVANGTTLTINAGQSLTVEEAIVNNGTILLQNSAALVQTALSNSNSGSGSYSVIRNTGSIADNTRYQYWGSPVSSTTMAAVFPNSNSSDYYAFNTTTQQWVAAGNMTPGVGYITTGDVNGGTNFAQDISFSGTINNAIAPLNTTVSNAGFILLSNPYPSALSSEDFVDENGGINGTLYFWNHSTPESNGQNDDLDYATWTGVGSTSGNAAEAPDDYIQSCQGFFVQANQANPTITFSNSQRVAGNNTQFFKRGVQEKRQRIWLSVSNDSSDFNQLLIGFLPEATKAIDRLYDGKKYKAHPRLAFYSEAVGEELAIQGLPYVFPDETTSIPLGVDAWITGGYTIKLDSINNWPSNYTTWLKDKQEDTLVALTDLPYRFDVDTIGAIKNRFALVVKHELSQIEGDTGAENVDLPDTTTGIEENQQNWLNVYVAQKELRVSASQEIREIAVFDLSGRIIYQENIGSSQYAHLFDENGLYFVQVSFNNGQKDTQKVFF